MATAPIRTTNSQNRVWKLQSIHKLLLFSYTLCVRVRQFYYSYIIIVCMVVSDCFFFSSNYMVFCFSLHSCSYLCHKMIDINVCLCIFALNSHSFFRTSCQRMMITFLSLICHLSFVCFQSMAMRTILPYTHLHWLFHNLNSTFNCDFIVISATNTRVLVLLNDKRWLVKNLHIILVVWRVRSDALSLVWKSIKFQNDNDCAYIDHTATGSHIIDAIFMQFVVASILLHTISIESWWGIGGFFIFIFFACLSVSVCAYIGCCEITWFSCDFFYQLKHQITK